MNCSEIAEQNTKELSLSCDSSRKILMQQYLKLPLSLPPLPGK